MQVESKENGTTQKAKKGASLKYNPIRRMLLISDKGIPSYFMSIKILNSGFGCQTLV